MKFLIMFVMIVAFSATGFSQTKKIAHRSHSGTDATFTPQTPGNFGETPEMEAARKKAEKMKADSIAKRAIADSMAKIKLLDKNKNKNKSKNKEKSETTFTRDSINKQR